MPSLFDGLPEIYRRLMPPDVFALEIPEETKSTCSSCAMCESSCGSAKVGAGEQLSPSDKPGAPGLFFSPSTKCCTFHPNLPSYLVGAILTDQSPEMARGRTAMEAKISARTGVTPYGIQAPGLYTLLYKNSREFFGRSIEMRCPYYIEEGGGLCSIWRHREAVCSTYFCKHVAGADGRRFYGLLKAHLALVEHQLSKFIIHRLYPEYVLDDLHPSDPPERRLDREEVEGRPLGHAAHKKIWGAWVGMEREFFEEAHHIASSFSPTEIDAVLGVDGKVSLSRLRKSWREMTQPKLPSKLKLNGDLTIRHEGGEVVIGAYSELDALALPSVAFDLLQAFKAEHEVSAVRAKLRREKQSDFSDDVLLALYQHRVLQEP